MIDLFKSKKESGKEGDFSYLEKGEIYLDSSCQTLRPYPVLLAQKKYYEEYNACGGRVKYEWGRRVDEEVMLARQALLKYLKKSSKEYFAAFTQSTTYAVNLVLSQLKSEEFDGIVTTDIEHNSVFLPSITYAHKNKWKRTVLARQDDGSVDVTQIPEGRVVFVANMVSNIDGRVFANMNEVIRKVHAGGGIVIVDAAQSMSSPEILALEYDVLCTSGHKMYAPSLGIIVAKHLLLSRMEFSFVGGGMVSDVEKDVYTLLPTTEEPWAMLEPGLQDWAAIIGLRAAISWLEKQDKALMKNLIQTLWHGIQSIPNIRLVTTEQSPVVSFHIDGLSSHRAAQALATQGIMVRSGYFCCHYYLQHVRSLPPLIRVSLGYHNSEEDIRQLISKLTILSKTL